MKTILYVIAFLATGGAAYYSYETQEIVKEEKAKHESLTKQLAQARRDYDSQLTKTQLEQKLLADAKKALNETNAGIQSAETDKGAIDRSLRDVTSKLEGVSGEVEQYESTLADTKKAFAEIFPGEDVNFENMEQKFQQFETSIKERRSKKSELDTLVEQASKRLAEQKSDLGQRVEKLENYHAKLRANQITGLVTAVNPLWGFVVVNLGENSGIDPAAELLVVRGTQRIGRISLASLERNQSIANINFGALSPGVMIRPGDRVILAEPSIGR